MARHLKKSITKQYIKKGQIKSFTLNCPQFNNPQNQTVHVAAFNESFRFHILKKYVKSHHPQSLLHSCVLVYVTSTVEHFLGLSEMLCGIGEGTRETALPLGTILITSSVCLKSC